MTMDWANERYVRLYVRDTSDLLAVGWEGRVVWYELLRNADRAGVIDASDIGILAEMLRLPREIVGIGYERLLTRGCVTKRDADETNRDSGVTLIPNFIEAQEAYQSDAQRARECRARRRDLIRMETVTKRDTNVTKRDTNVTPYRTVLNCTSNTRGRAHVDDNKPAEETPHAPTGRVPVFSSSQNSRKRKRTPDQDPAGAREVRSHFSTRFSAAHSGEKPTWNAKTKELLRGLLKEHSLETIKRRIDVFFESPSTFPPSRDFSTLVNHFDKFAGSKAKSDANEAAEAMRRAREKRKG